MDRGRRMEVSKFKSVGWRRILKKTALLLAITMITAMIMLTVSSVQAITYLSYAMDLAGCWKVWLTVDTTARTLEVKWAEPFLGLSY